MRNPELNNEALNLLWNAEALLSQARHWTRGTNARDEFFKAVEPRSPLAVQWDISGALDKVGGPRHPAQERARSFLAEASWAEKARSFVEFNDTRSHSEVVRLMKEAINRAKYAE
jgi:hypothetical protein